MAPPMTVRLSQMGYGSARRLLVVVGLVVMAVVVATMLVRGVDPVEVAATVLFVPIFAAFVAWGVAGGLIAAVLAVLAYAALRYPAIDAVGIGEFTGLLVSRAAAYLIFGAVGGWSMQVLESALTKLELYDALDDETGLANARHMVTQLDLERSRARRYESLFSVVVLDLPAGPSDGLAGRRRRALWRELGIKLAEGARTMDHVVHTRDGDRHLVAAVLPETAGEGARIFGDRFRERVEGFMAERGADVAGRTELTCLTVPGDEEALDAVAARFGRIEAASRASAPP
ncbi:MAG: hypothetical protein AB7L84_10630 [Acidimicrobiia bacterium]